MSNLKEVVDSEEFKSLSPLEKIDRGFELFKAQVNSNEDALNVYSQLDKEGRQNAYDQFKGALYENFPESFAYKVIDQKEVADVGRMYSEGVTNIPDKKILPLYDSKTETFIENINQGVIDPEELDGASELLAFRVARERDLPYSKKLESKIQSKLKDSYGIDDSDLNKIFKGAMPRIGSERQELEAYIKNLELKTDPKFNAPFDIKRAEKELEKANRYLQDFDKVQEIRNVLDPERDTKEALGAILGNVVLAGSAGIKLSNLGANIFSKEIMAEASKLGTREAAKLIGKQAAIGTLAQGSAEFAVGSLYAGRLPATETSKNIINKVFGTELTEDSPIVTGIESAVLGTAIGGLIEGFQSIKFAKKIKGKTPEEFRKILIEEFGEDGASEIQEKLTKQATEHTEETVEETTEEAVEQADEVVATDATTQAEAPVEDAPITQVEPEVAPVVDEAVQPVTQQTDVAQDIGKAQEQAGDVIQTDVTTAPIKEPEISQTEAPIREVDQAIEPEQVTAPDVVNMSESELFDIVADSDDSLLVNKANEELDKRLKEENINKRERKTSKNKAKLSELGVDTSKLPSEYHITTLSKDDKGYIQARIEVHTESGVSPKMVTVKSGDAITPDMDDVIPGTTRSEEAYNARSSRQDVDPTKTTDRRPESIIKKDSKIDETIETSKRAEQTAKEIAEKKIAEGVPVEQVDESLKTANEVNKATSVPKKTVQASKVAKSEEALQDNSKAIPASKEIDAEDLGFDSPEESLVNNIKPKDIDYTGIPEEDYRKFEKQWGSIDDVEKENLINEIEGDNLINPETGKKVKLSEIVNLKALDGMSTAGAARFLDNLVELYKSGALLKSSKKTLESMVRLARTIDPETAVTGMEEYVKNNIKTPEMVVALKNHLDKLNKDIDILEELIVKAKEEKNFNLVDRYTELLNVAQDDLAATIKLSANVKTVSSRVLNSFRASYSDYNSFDYIIKKAKTRMGLTQDMDLPSDVYRTLKKEWDTLITKQGEAVGAINKIIEENVPVDDIWKEIQGYSKIESTSKVDDLRTQTPAGRTPKVKVSDPASKKLVNKVAKALNSKSRNLQKSIFLDSLMSFIGSNPTSNIANIYRASIINGFASKLKSGAYKEMPALNDLYTALRSELSDIAKAGKEATGARPQPKNFADQIADIVSNPEENVLILNKAREAIIRASLPIDQKNSALAMLDIMRGGTVPPSLLSKAVKQDLQTLGDITKTDITKRILDGDGDIILGDLKARLKDRIGIVGEEADELSQLIEEEFNSIVKKVRDTEYKRKNKAPTPKQKKYSEVVEDYRKSTANRVLTSFKEKEIADGTPLGDFYNVIRKTLGFPKEGSRSQVTKSNVITQIGDKLKSAEERSVIVDRIRNEILNSDMPAPKKVEMLEQLKELEGKDYISDDIKKAVNQEIKALEDGLEYSLEEMVDAGIEKDVLDEIIEKITKGAEDDSPELIDAIRNHFADRVKDIQDAKIKKTVKTVERKLKGTKKQSDRAISKAVNQLVKGGQNVAEKIKQSVANKLQSALKDPKSPYKDIARVLSDSLYANAKTVAKQGIERPKTQAEISDYIGNIVKNRDLNRDALLKARDEILDNPNINDKIKQDAVMAIDAILDEPINPDVIEKYIKSKISGVIDNWKAVNADADDLDNTFILNLNSNRRIIREAMMDELKTATGLSDAEFKLIEDIFIKEFNAYADSLKMKEINKIINGSNKKVSQKTKKSLSQKLERAILQGYLNSERGREAFIQMMKLSPEDGKFVLDAISDTKGVGSQLFKIQSALKKLRRTSGLDFLVATMKTFVLGVKTFIEAGVGTSVNTAIRMLTNPIETFWAKVAKPVFGVDLGNFKTPKDFNNFMSDLRSGSIRGIEDALNIIKTGIDPREINKLDIVQQVNYSPFSNFTSKVNESFQGLAESIANNPNKPIGWIGEGLKQAGRFSDELGGPLNMLQNMIIRGMASMDPAIVSVIKDVELRRLAESVANFELKLGKITQADLANRISELMYAPTKEMSHILGETLQEITLTKSNIATKMVNAGVRVAEAQGDVIGDFAKFLQNSILMFVRTGSNATALVSRLTPILGGVSKSLKARTALKEAIKIEQKAGKQTIESLMKRREAASEFANMMAFQTLGAIFGGAVYFNQFGYGDKFEITAGYDALDPARQRLLQAKGIDPESLIIWTTNEDGTKEPIQFSSIARSNYVMAYMSAVQAFKNELDKFIEDDVVDVRGMKGMGAYLVQTVFNNPLTSGAETVSKIVEDPIKGVKKLTEDKLAMLFPSVITQTAQMFGYNKLYDPKQDTTAPDPDSNQLIQGMEAVVRSGVAKVLSRSPWDTGFLDVRVNALGEEMVGDVVRKYLGFNTRIVMNQAMDEMLRLGVGLSAERDEKTKISKMRGRKEINTETAIQNLIQLSLTESFINKKRYDIYTDTQKKKILNKLKDESSQYAKGIIESANAYKDRNEASEEEYGDYIYNQMQRILKRMRNADESVLLSKDILKKTPLLKRTNDEFLKQPINPNTGE